MPKRELEFRDRKSQKFWSIEWTGKSHTVTFGRIGTNGQSKRKDFATPDKARRSFEQLVRQKLGKGYVDTASDAPLETNRARLNAAFLALNRRGIIALHEAGFTLSDGYEDFQDAYEAHPNRASVTGYCFYHEQDVESARLGRSLCLAFGPSDPDDEETRGPEVGRVVREELERVGLVVNWDGTFARRIEVVDFQWVESAAPAKKTTAKKTPKPKSAAKLRGASKSQATTTPKAAAAGQAKTKSQAATTQQGAKRPVEAKKATRKTLKAAPKKATKKISKKR